MINKSLFHAIGQIMRTHLDLDLFWKNPYFGSFFPYSNLVEKLMTNDQISFLFPFFFSFLYFLNTGGTSSTEAERKNFVNEK